MPCGATARDKLSTYGLQSEQRGREAVRGAAASGAPRIVRPTTRGACAMAEHEARLARALRGRRLPPSARERCWRVRPTCEAICINAVSRRARGGLSEAWATSTVRFGGVESCDSP